MDWRVETAQREILKLADASLTLRSVATRLRTSPANLGRLFLNEVGKPFRECLLDARVARAQELLAESELTIKEIAHTIGFKNASALFRAFHRTTGTTPGIYRAYKKLDLVVKRHYSSKKDTINGT